MMTNTTNLIDIAREILLHSDHQHIYHQKDVSRIILALLLYLDVDPELFKQADMAAYRSTNLHLKLELESLKQEQEVSVSGVPYKVPRSSIKSNEVKR